MDQNTDLLNSAVLWWANRDEFGGFRTAGDLLWANWKPARYCKAPDRPKDRDTAFGIHRNDDGCWFFKDYVTGQAGGLVEFVMRIGWSRDDSLLWLVDIAGRACQNYSSPRAWLPSPRERHIHFFSPLELTNYQPTHDVSLVGDCHIMRGEVFVIGGEPGVGKSRAATALAVAGAIKVSWFGLAVHRQFRTLIIQTENSLSRLRDEYSNFQSEPLLPWIRVSAPPPFGLTLRNDEFQADIRFAIDEFKPDCVILDPWNAAARDDKQREYSAAFDTLRQILPTGADKPALGVVAHTRKPRPNEKRTGGTGLMHLLAGSYILSSIPRTVFVMARASERESDPRVVWFNPKNNNGNLNARTAWSRNARGFEPIPGFEWDAFDNSAGGQRPVVTLAHLHALFAVCDHMELPDAVRRLSAMANIAEKSAYAALNEQGKFCRYLIRDGKTIHFKP